MEIKPFIKWAGGKGKLISELKKFIPQKFNNYFEPFVGGGALFFYLNSNYKIPKAYINDINLKLINAYKQIQENPNILVKKLIALENCYKKLNENEREKHFYHLRDLYNKNDIDKLTQAAYLIFLNKTGYNGMYRENSKGLFNIPFGDQKNPTICDENNIYKVSQCLKNTLITNKPFEQAVLNCKKGDYIYFDPPYFPISKTSSFTGYSKNSFNVTEQRKLKAVFQELSQKGCFVMLSNSYTEFTEELYKDYNINYLMAARSINSKGKGRGKIKEIVVTNY